MAVIDDFIALAKKSPKRIVLPESLDERIIESAATVTKEGIAQGILVGSETEIRKKAKEVGIDISGVKIVDPSKSSKTQTYIRAYMKMRNKSEAIARNLMNKPLYHACMMVKQGDADGIIGGCVHTSGEFIAAAHLIIGLQKGIETPSSLFLMDIPNYGQLIFADCAMNIQPTAEQLADIAVASANSAKNLMGWEPKVAMLSFSTKGSATHPDADKVIKATGLAKKKMPDLKIDGELQGDSALVKSTAEKKLKGNLGAVAGQANVLVFPDLDAANIAYKLTQTLANATAYGPILQGFAKSASDLSRGAKVKDMVGTIAMVSVIAKGMEK
jgi:phosphate acetyltransferase